MPRLPVVASAAAMAVAVAAIVVATAGHTGVWTSEPGESRDINQDALSQGALSQDALKQDPLGQDALATQAAQAPVSGNEIMARNHQAWASVDRLYGVFRVVGSGTYVEWVERRPTLRLRRQAVDEPRGRADETLGGTGAAATELLGSVVPWAVFDGRDSWVRTEHGRVVRADAAGLGVELVCERLRLPEALDPAGPAETLTSSDRLLYRLQDTTSGRVYTVDASDHLVWTIADPSGAILWSREHLQVNPVLPDHIFSPTESVAPEASGA